MFGQTQPTGGLIGHSWSLVYELAATWRCPTFIQVTRVNSHNRINDKLNALKMSSWSLLFFGTKQ